MLQDLTKWVLLCKCFIDQLSEMHKLYGYTNTDDGGALLTFEAMAKAARFANTWVPFFRKHDIEPRNPESYFNFKRDPYKNKVKTDFVKDRRLVKHKYDEFKVCINGLPNSICRHSDAYHAREEIKAMKLERQKADDEPVEFVKIPKDTWMDDGTHGSDTWMSTLAEHSRGDHARIMQGIANDSRLIDLSEVDIHLPIHAYISCEKHPGYDHNNKAGSMKALVRASTMMSNGPFILNLDCDHYIYNSQALRECAMNTLVRASEIMSNWPFILNLDCDHDIYNS